MKTPRPAIILACSFVAAACFASAQVEAPAPALHDHERRLPGLRERLIALHPDEPVTYFELAEEIAAELNTPAGRKLARELCVLAHEADRRHVRPRGLAPSVYLALAHYADSRVQRLAMEALVEPSRVAGSGRLAGSDEATAVREIDLADAVAALRAGSTRELKETLKDPASQDALIEAAARDPILARVIEMSARDLSCLSCRNRRVVQGAAEPAEHEGSKQIVLCPICRGNPGPGWLAPEIAATLAFESHMVGADHIEWSGAVWLDRGEPLLDPSPEDLCETFGVSPSSFFWHPDENSEDPLAGRWTNTSYKEFLRRVRQPG